MQRQIDDEGVGTAAGGLDIEAALVRLGATEPATLQSGTVRARTELADAILARLGAIKPSRRGTEDASESSEVAALSTRLVLQPLAPAQRRRRMAFKVASVVSLLVHAGSLAAFVTWHGAETGAIEHPSEAISVEIVASRTLEATQPQQIPEPAPSPEPTAPKLGKTEASDTPVVKQTPAPEPEPEVALPQPPIPEAEDEAKPTAKQEVPGKVETPPLPVQGPAEVVPEPPKATVADEDADARRREQKRIEKKKAAERAPKGGITSKASAGKGTGGDRASASTGSVLAYAAHVRARVAGNKPSGGGSQGTAVVSFRVTTAGGLASVSVARSSGSAALDQLAIAAVRGAAPFPAPPAGATPGQLFFTIPFHFQ